MTNERHEKALEAAEWIEHDGQGMPIDGKTMVQIICRDGWKSYWPHEARDHDYYSWTGEKYDITHYRIVAPNHFTNGE